MNRKPPNAGKGRKKGVPNKVTGELRDMIMRALDKAGGENYLLLQAKQNPQAFLPLLGRVLPKDIKLDVAGKLQVILNGNGVRPEP